MLGNSMGTLRLYELLREVQKHLGGLGLASNPGFPFRILSRTSDFSSKLRNKIQNRKPGFEASLGHAPLENFTAGSEAIL